MFLFPNKRGKKTCKESRNRLFFIQKKSGSPNFGFHIVAPYDQLSPTAAHVYSLLLSLIPKLSNTGALGVWPA